MRANTLNEAIACAEQGHGPLAQLTRKAIEVGVIVPSILERELVDAGYVINSRPGAKHGMWVEIFKDEQLVAQAFSHDRSDALLQAIAAELREGR